MDKKLKKDTFWIEIVQNKQTRLMYFNYHAKVKRLIFEGRLKGYEFVDDYHGIKPALVLYFEDARPMPIRDYMWEEYIPFLMKFDEKNE